MAAMPAMPLKMVSCPSPVYNNPSDGVRPSEAKFPVIVSRSCSMHLVFLGWLYVIGMMAITAPTLLRGLLLLVVGVLPVVAITVFFGRRARAQQARGAESEAKTTQSPTRLTPSFEQAVNRRDDGDA
ncbi:MAG: hypothetical protein ABJC33_04115 [Betaproteobacteria bacterium]